MQILETSANEEHASGSSHNESSYNNYSNITETTVETIYELLRKPRPFKREEQPY